VRRVDVRRLLAPRRGGRTYVLRLPGNHRYSVAAPPHWAWPGVAGGFVALGVIGGVALSPLLGGQSSAATIVAGGPPAAAQTAPAPAPTRTPTAAAPRNTAPAPKAASSPEASAAPALPTTDFGASAPAAPAPASTGTSGSTPTTPTTQPDDNTQTVAGTVVHVAAPRQSYTVATDDGTLYAVHAEKQPAVGTKLTEKVKPLANGTFGQAKAPKEAKADAKTAKIAGTVTWANADSGVYTVSARGASILVHGAQPPPALLAPVTVTVSMTPDGLQQTAIDASDPLPGTVDIAGTVQHVDAQARHITLAADDVREAGADIDVAVPDTIDITKIAEGDQIDATVTIGTDGSYGLTGASFDQDATAANDGKTALGDQASG
jgi:Cu/Ag efflux protein CusF